MAGGGERLLSAAASKGRLEGKVALVTGGASGLGKAAAHEFIQEGAQAVILADINCKLGPETARELGPKAHFVHCDVAAEDSVAAAVDAAVARHGRLDVMLNSAGVVGPLSPGTSQLASLDFAQFDAVMSVNVRGTLAGIKHATRVMVAPPAGAGADGGVGGSIICMASISGILGGLGTYPYSVSKFAIAGIVKAAAAELSRHGVRVNCISPYAVATPMVVDQFSALLGGAADEAQVVAIIRGLGELKGATCEAVDIARAAVYLASDDAKLEGKIALITGGASGLGKATAHEFIQEGAAAVVIADVNSRLGLEAAEELGPRAQFVHCDVTVEESVAEAVDATVARHGRLDVMLNNAGVVGSLAGTSRMADLDLAQFDAVMAVNVRGTLAGIKHATRVMAPPVGAGSGSILCMASVSGVLGGLGTYPYSVSKFAVAGVVKAAAAELSRHGVRVNCISPYAVPTPMVMDQFSTMLGGAADEEQVAAIIRGLGELKGATCEAVDVAKAAVYLASDDAKYVSGHNLVVDGGFTSYKRMNLPFPKKPQE
ncbi:Short-chain dehydrogenase reductase 2a [Dichanthelium oligosanthes]|uniref:Short-chain dehydrogenase reductase 2a n=1 Tax=Dichanthelium oligosanthes TaxID=888268 RepID=A0A1E5UZD6_9POAL|nr:Short-chain dehydrogenase reductase 2a [Dichanthelium oligosanthes]